MHIEQPRVSSLVDFALSGGSVVVTQAPGVST